MPVYGYGAEAFSTLHGHLASDSTLRQLGPSRRLVRRSPKRADCRPAARDELALA